MTTLRFYTRQGCPLCDEAFEAIAPITTEAGVAVEVIDIDLDLGLLGRYNERVPVIETEDGSVVTEGIIDIAAVELAVR